MVNARSLSVDGRLKVFLVAGEASGDAYGAAALKALRAECAKRGWELDAVGWGGDLMAAEGMRLLKHYRTMSFMGFWEVAKHLSTILRNLQRAHQDVQREAPDIVLTLDFPGFNMRLAKALARAKHPALRVQWVAPQVWAWKPGRAKQLARDFDAVAPILPFEQEVLERAGVEVWPCGHPLLDVLASDEPNQGRDIALALLPGSRAQELRSLLPVLVEAAENGAAKGWWSLEQVVVAGAPGRSRQDYVLAEHAGIDVVFGQTQNVLRDAKQAWVASGTATLEAALLNTPMVVVYRTSELTYRLAKRLARVNFISLPNLLLDRACVPELIQHDCTATRLLEATEKGLEGQLKGFDDLRNALGESGAAQALAQRVAKVFGEGSEPHH
jgi:lipid-A-disaccharide synthase